MVRVRLSRCTVGQLRELQRRRTFLRIASLLRRCPTYHHSVSWLDLKEVWIPHLAFSKLYSTSGGAVTPTAARIRCLRFAHRVRHACSHDSAMDARRDTGGWRALTRQGLSPCKRCQAGLGAITLPVSSGPQG